MKQTRLEKIVGQDPKLVRLAVGCVRRLLLHSDDEEKRLLYIWCHHWDGVIYRAVTDDGVVDIECDKRGTIEKVQIDGKKEKEEVDGLVRWEDYVYEKSSAVRKLIFQTYRKEVDEVLDGEIKERLGWFRKWKVFADDAVHLSHDDPVTVSKTLLYRYSGAYRRFLDTQPAQEGRSYSYPVEARDAKTVKMLVERDPDVLPIPWHALLTVASDHDISLQPS